MNELEEMRLKKVSTAIEQALKEIAPEVEIKTLIPEQAFRDQIDLDSMDQFNMITKIHELLKVDIPITDYSKITSLKQMIEYLCKKIT